MKIFSTMEALDYEDRIREVENISLESIIVSSHYNMVLIKESMLSKFMELDINDIQTKYKYISEGITSSEIDDLIDSYEEVTESLVSDIIDHIKRFIQYMAKNISNILDKLILMYHEYMNGTKRFIDKYSDEIKKYSTFDEVKEIKPNFPVYRETIEGKFLRDTIKATIDNLNQYMITSGMNINELRKISSELEDAEKFMDLQRFIMLNHSDTKDVLKGYTSIPKDKYLDVFKSIMIESDKVEDVDLDDLINTMDNSNIIPRLRKLSGVVKRQMKDALDRSNKLKSFYSSSEKEMVHKNKDPHTGEETFSNFEGSDKDLAIVAIKRYSICLTATNDLITTSLMQWKKHLFSRNKSYIAYMSEVLKVGRRVFKEQKNKGK